MGGIRRDALSSTISESSSSGQPGSTRSCARPNSGNAKPNRAHTEVIDQGETGRVLRVPTDLAVVSIGVLADQIFFRASPAGRARLFANHASRSHREATYGVRDSPLRTLIESF